MAEANPALPPENLDPLGQRDVDAESSKPKLETADGKSKPPAKVNPPQQKTGKVTIKSPSGATDILLDFSRLQLTQSIHLEKSSFIPCCLQMYRILHSMDSLIAQNQNLLKQTRLWHPLISRLYHGLLFLIQTLRCMDYAKITNHAQKRFLHQFLKHYPADILMIAGPLLPVFKSLSCTKSALNAFSLIVPYLPPELGTQNLAEELINHEIDSFILPQIPLILAMINDLKRSNDAQFTATWSPMPALPAPEQQHIVLGFPFQHENEPAVMWPLAAPGICHPLEAHGSQSKTFKDELSCRNIPIVGPNVNCTDIAQFTQLSPDDVWFQDVLQCMSLYADFFSNKGTLADCPPLGPGTALVETYPIPPTTPPRVPTSAFPANSLPIYDVRHKTREPRIDPGTSKLAMLAQINCIFSANFPEPLANACAPDTDSRLGPYYSIEPFHSTSNVDSTHRLLSQTVSTFYRPKGPK